MHKVLHPRTPNNFSRNRHTTQKKGHIQLATVRDIIFNYAFEYNSDDLYHIGINLLGIVKIVYVICTKYM